MRDLPPDPACPNCAKLQKRIEALEALVAKLSAHVKALTARLKQNSSNSSKPPSSDAPWRKPPSAKESSGRKPGTQPGHLGHCRGRLPPERLTRVVHYVPEVCTDCRTPLADTLRVDITELVRGGATTLDPIPALRNQARERFESCLSKAGQVELQTLAVLGAMLDSALSRNR